VKDLHKTFQEGVDINGKPLKVFALQGVSFDIYPGEFVAITGPNGSGKSTLINCLGAFEKADPSQLDPIQYSDQETLQNIWRDPEWYRQNFVGIVFQDFHLLPTLHVDQNVEFPLRLRQCSHYSNSADERQRLVVEALERLHIKQHATKKVNQISGGERQRVAIARALVKEPRLLLADEPTGNLDQENKVSIVEQLRGLAKGNLSVLMVTHDRDLAERYADRIIHMVDGKIVSNGFNSKKVARSVEEAPNEQLADSAKVAVPSTDFSSGSGDPTPPSVPVAAADPGNVDPKGPGLGSEPSVDSADAEGPVLGVFGGDGRAVGAAAASAGGDVHAAVAEDGPKASTAPTKTARKDSPGSVFLPGCSQSFPDLVRYSLRDARQSTVSLASNIFAILLGTFLTAMLLALLGGTEEYIRYLFRTIPGIDSVQVWVDYSTGETPLTDDEVKSLSNWPGAQAVVPSINQFVPLFQKPTREVIASLFSTQHGDPEIARLQLVAGSRDVNPDGWDVILPMRIAEEVNNLNPQGLVGNIITLQLRRYDRSSKVEGSKPSETLDYPLRVVGILKTSPQDRAYSSLNVARFVRDFSTGRSGYVPEPGKPVDSTKISVRTVNESLRVHFAGPAAAEKAFLEMKRGGKQRFESAWPGEKMLYLRDVETVSTIVLVGIGLLAIVAGAVSIFNTLLASVARKTKEIGIMRAMGVARADVFLMFMAQSVIIGIVACLVGLAVAWTVMVPLNAYIGSRWEQLADPLKDIGGLFQFSLPMALSLVVAVLGICVVAAFLPALRAASKTPMDALREQ